MSKVLSDLKQSELSYFQEELAKTYFSAAPPKQSHSTYSKSDLKNRKSRYLLYGIFFSVLTLLILAFFVSNRIEIAIKVTPAVRLNSSSGNNPSEIIYLNKGGELNTRLVKNVVFYENSGSESGLGKDFILLANETVSKKAALGIDFTGPLDLRKNLFCFHSKGKEGGEEVRIGLKDDKNNFCYSKVNELKNSWQQFMIDAEAAKDFLDLEHITHIDLEVNPNERQNPTSNAVYVKDIYLAKKED